MRSLQKFDDGFGAGADVEFFVDVLKVGADGVDANIQMIGNFFGGIAFGKLLENFLFALG